MQTLLSTRMIFLAMFLMCCFLIAVALYMQEQLGMHPCPLCITQRVFVIVVGLLSFLAFVHNSSRLLWHRLYIGLAAAAAIVGGIVSGRHVWLQNLPEDQVPACGPSLSYMFENFPLMQAFNLLFAGDGNCADIVWTFLGLSIPGWTLVAFVVLFLATVVQFFRQP